MLEGATCWALLFVPAAIALIDYTIRDYSILGSML